MKYCRCAKPVDCIAACSSKNLTKPRAREMNPPDLWIHGAVSAVGDNDRDSYAGSSSVAARSDRMGSFTRVT